MRRYYRKMGIQQAEKTETAARALPKFLQHAIVYSSEVLPRSRAQHFLFTISMTTAALVGAILPLTNVHRQTLSGDQVLKETRESRLSQHWMNDRRSVQSIFAPAASFAYGSIDERKWTTKQGFKNKNKGSRTWRLLPLCYQRGQKKRYFSWCLSVLG